MLDKIIGKWMLVNKHVNKFAWFNSNHQYVYGHRPTLTELPREILIPDSFFWHGAEGVCDGPSTKQKHGVYAAVSSKTAGTIGGIPSFSPHDACLMQISASESLFFPFSLTEGGNLGWIWRSGQEHVFATKWA